MTNQEVITGMVLSAMPIGDFDKRLVILTKEHGKISAFARGARKSNSALLACTQPFVFGQFQLFAGKNSYTVVSGEISQYFAELREDLEAVSYGFYFCELVGFLTRENIDATNLLKLLYQSFRVLIKKTIPFPLIRSVFEMKAMFLNGIGPQVFSCVGHKRKEAMPPFVAFSSEKCGILCAECAEGKKTVRVSSSTIYTLQFIAQTPIEKLFTFTVSQEVLSEIKTITKDYLAVHLEAKFKSLEMLYLLT